MVMGFDFIDLDALDFDVVAGVGLDVMDFEVLDWR